jgi:hypothetical protein
MRSPCLVFYFSKNVSFRNFLMYIFSVFAVIIIIPRLLLFLKLLFILANSEEEVYFIASSLSLIKTSKQATARESTVWRVSKRS